MDTPPSASLEFADRPVHLPDFILIGAGKSGTTAFHQTISQHPDIFCTNPKEPNFFAYPEMFTRTRGTSPERDKHTEAAYRSLFVGAQESQIRGEASVGYLPLPHVPSRVHHYVPKVKLIAILRHPVDRAYSSWLHRRHQFKEPISDFEAACQAGPERIAAGWNWYWDYLNIGYYARHLQRWFSHFPRDQFKIFLYEDWRDSPETMLRSTFEFLGVDPERNIHIEQINVTSIRPRFSSLHSILNSRLRFRSLVQKTVPKSIRTTAAGYLRKLNRGKAPGLDSSLRAKMTAPFHDDIKDLEKLLQRDLSHWHTHPKKLSDHHLKNV